MISKYPNGTPFFTAGRFTATPVFTCEDKARIANKMALFLLAGCPRKTYDRAFWEETHRLFGHMAHYDAEGFWQEWFSSPQRQIAYIELMMAWPCYGDPAYMPCDIEQRLKDWALARPLIASICNHIEYKEAA